MALEGSFLKVLLGRQALSPAGLLFPAASGKEPKDRSPNLDMEKALEDEAADMFGQLCLSLVVQMVPGGLSMNLPWPHKVLTALTSDALAPGAIDKFRADQAMLRKLVAKPGQNGAEQLIDRQHLINRRSVKQPEVRFEQIGFAMSPVMRWLLVS